MYQPLLDYINERKNKKLMTDYYVYILNKLINEYKHNNFYIPLKAEYLKEAIGSNYTLYIKDLIKMKLMFCDNKFEIGKKCKHYNLTPTAIGLLDYNKKIDYQFTSVHLLNIFEKTERQSIKDLKYFTLDINKINIENYDDNIQKQIKSIIDGRRFDTKGKFVDRWYNSFSNLPKELRQCIITTDGNETIEFDIKQCQPRLLIKLMEYNHVEINDNFKYLVENDKLYDYINKDDRSAAKIELYKIIFGWNCDNNGKVVSTHKWFDDMFESVMSFIVDYKKENGGHNSLSIKLQNEEADIMYKKIIPELKKYMDETYNIYLPLFTIHDSIIFPKEYATCLIELWDELELKYFG